MTKSDIFSSMRLGRRSVISGAAAAGGLMLLAVPLSGAFAAARGKRMHGLSAFGDLKYASGFKHFDYVNAKAPKAGRFNFTPPNWAFNQNIQTFNTLNSFVLRGDAPPRMEMCFDTLMTRALDEPDALYCHAAEWVEVSEDGNTYRFGLREGVHFHDGSPVTAGDVAFSFMLVKDKGHPQLAFPLAELKSAEAPDRRTVVLTFSGRQSAHAILTALSSPGTPIFSKAYYTAHSFDSSSLDIPPSSGPYRVADFEAGRYIEYERVADYWGQALPTAVGLNNFERIRIDFFVERAAAFEAFKKGTILFKEEFTSKTWATEYDFPALTQDRVIKDEFPEEMLPTMQAWALNQRRERFSDPRVRQAIDLCFDFEWTNAKIFYNAYTRAQSLFENSDFKTDGPPKGAELDLLKSLKSPLPDGVMGPAALQPVSDGSGRDRSLLKKAYDLLSDAGWTRQDDVLRKNGEALTLEILIRSSAFERLLSSFVENLRRVGIRTTVRLVDPAQYQARLNTFDFDMTGIARRFGATPTAEDMTQYFSSASVDRPGSSNLCGASAPVYDELLDHLKTVGNRGDLVTVMRVLDRVERARLDWIPNWYAANHRVAYWDVFGFVSPKPDYGWPVESLWWHDGKKAKAIGK